MLSAFGHRKQLADTKRLRRRMMTDHGRYEDKNGFRIRDFRKIVRSD